MKNKGFTILIDIILIPIILLIAFLVFFPIYKEEKKTLEESQVKEYLGPEGFYRSAK